MSFLASFCSSLFGECRLEKSGITWENLTFWGGSDGGHGDGGFRMVSSTSEFLFGSFEPRSKTGKESKLGDLLVFCMWAASIVSFAALSLDCFRSFPLLPFFCHGRNGQVGQLLCWQLHTPICPSCLGIHIRCSFLLFDPLLQFSHSPLGRHPLIGTSSGRRGVDEFLDGQVLLQPKRKREQERKQRKEETERGKKGFTLLHLS